MRSFTVKYADNEEVVVMAVKRSVMAELLELQKNLLAEFIFKGGMIGDLLEPNNKKIWGYINKICSLLLLAGGGTLDSDRIDDLDELMELFFTQSKGIDDETGAVLPDKEGDPYLPSKIAKLHGWSFFRADRTGVWQEASIQAQKMFDLLKQEIMDRRKQEIAEIEDKEIKEKQTIQPKQEMETPIPLQSFPKSVQEVA